MDNLQSYIQKQNGKQGRYANLLKMIRIYIIPLVILAIFFGIIIIVIIPKISDVFSTISGLQENHQQIEEKDKYINQLRTKAANSQTFTAQLEEINDIAPEQEVEVVDFRDRITELATKNSLQITGQSLSERSNEEDSESEYKLVGDVNLQEVPVTIDLRGGLSSIRQFIEQLDALEDFVVVKHLELSNPSESEVWNMRMVLVKYQFGGMDDQKLIDIYMNVSIETQLDDFVREYLEERI